MPINRLSGLIWLTLTDLPSASSLRTGTSFAVTDYGGNIATAVGGQWRFEYPFRTTWEGRPPVSAVPIGTELQVTDYANQKWISDGIYWRPAQGRAMLLNKWGTPSTPLAVLTGAVDSQFTLTEKAVKTGILIPGCKLSAQMWVRRGGSAGTAYVYAKLGTTDSYSDAMLAGIGLSATDNLSTRMDVLAIITSTTLFTMATTAPGSSSISPSKSSSNFSIASDMYFSVHIRAANVSDTFILVGYQLVMEA